MISSPKRLCLVGKHSELTKYLIPALSEKDLRVELLSLRDISKLDELERRRIWEGLASSGAQILWVGAIIDPSFDSREIMRVNYELPIEALESIRHSSRDSLIITFGSALENSQTPNPYLFSKLSLARAIQELNSEASVHIRTHTLVSDSPPPGHMFLGQLFLAAKLGQNLTIKSPGQMREYVDARAFSRFIVNEVLDNQLPSRRGVTTVGNGDPIEISMLADEIMREHSPNSQISRGQVEARTTFLNQPNSQNDLIISSERSSELVIRKFRTWMAKN